MGLAWPFCDQYTQRTLVIRIIHLYDDSYNVVSLNTTADLGNSLHFQRERHWVTIQRLHFRTQEMYPLG